MPRRKRAQSILRPDVLRGILRYHGGMNTKLQSSDEKIHSARISFAALGMLAGVGLGGALGTLLLALTGEAIYVAIAGVGAGIGLSLGAAVDQQKRQRG